MSGGIWEVYALRYAERAERVRADSFLFDDHASPHPIDYFVWLLRDGDGRQIVVDTGYDRAEGARRDRPVFDDPAACLAAFGCAPERVDTVIVTHLHYDHAGGLAAFPAARFHLQAAEMAYATGPCMCEAALNHPFTAEHVCEMVRHVYSGRVVFHDGDAEVTPGIEVFRIGGHSLGLQAVRVATARGPLVLASDAAHYYENFLAGKLFPIVAEAGPMLAGFRRLPLLAGADTAVIPGHDPMVREMFPRVAGSDAAAGVYRLDVAPADALAGRLAALRGAPAR